MFRKSSTNVIIRSLEARSKQGQSKVKAQHQPRQQCISQFSLSFDMGIIVSCFAYGANEIKERRDYKKKGVRIQNSGNETLPQSQTLASATQHDAQQGLQDEHLAAVPPGDHTVVPASVGSAEVTRTVATEAPVPVPGGATA